MLSSKKLLLQKNSLNKKKYGFAAAISIVIANMVGTGVFTSLGFQLMDLHNINALIFLWILGGFIAILGSFCYAELSSAFPGSGGEYHFLRLSFNDSIGFLSGWASAFVAFAAPIAACAFAFSSYFENVFQTGFDQRYLSVALIVFVTLIQMLNVHIGGRFQVYFTAGKIVLIVVLILAGYFYAPHLSAQSSGLTHQDFWKALTLPAFWVGLIYVSYSYSGWNATAYIIDDIENPKKIVPRSILLGTLLVMVLYVLINHVFLITAPAAEMSGREDVAHVAAHYIFGAAGAKIISGMIAFFLISSISSMTIVGPRVIKRISHDYRQFSYFSHVSKHHVPVRAILLQSAIAIILLLTSSFSFIITSVGVILSVFTTLTAIGLIVMRIKHPHTERPIKVPFYPLTPLLFILFNLFTIGYFIVNKPTEALAGLVFLVVGFIIYLFLSPQHNEK